MTVLEALALTVALAACAADADDTMTTGGTGQDVQRRVTIAVSEEPWQRVDVDLTSGAETASSADMTRAGETMESLRATTAQSWDFTTTSPADVAMLGGDTDNWTDAEDKGQYLYKNELANAALLANGQPLTICNRLLFTAEAKKVKININNCIWLGGTGITLTIPDLKKGQEVKIVFTSSGDDERTFGSYNNLSKVSGFVAESEKTMHTGKGSVTEDGDVTFTTNSALYIYSIEVSARIDEGFGLYSETLGVKNSHIVWKTDILNWAGISNDFYLMLWPNNTVNKDLAFTAYAPYVDDSEFKSESHNVGDDEDPGKVSDFGVTARGATTLRFMPHSDNRIDLLYAKKTITDDGVLQLDFKHALGKLSIGTITNGFGEDITLTQIKISGTRVTKADLALASGEWSNKTENSADVTYNSDALSTLFGSLEIADGRWLTFPRNVAYTQIPGTTLTFEYTFKTQATQTTFTVSKAIPVEAGINKFVNINVDQNHAVMLR